MNPDYYGEPVALSKIGEDACALILTRAINNVTIHVSVLAGPDVIRVTYSAQPSAPDRVSTAAQAVAGNILARS